MKIESLHPNITPEWITTLEPLAPAPSSFAHILAEKISDTNQQLQQADQALQQLASHQATNLHHIMLTLEQAKLSFQFLEQIRNRLMSAYQELMREAI